MASAEIARDGILTGRKVIVGGRMRCSYAVSIDFPPLMKFEDKLACYSNCRTPHIQTDRELPFGTSLTLGQRVTKPGRNNTIYVMYSIVEYPDLHLTTIDGWPKMHAPKEDSY